MSYFFFVESEDEIQFLKKKYKKNVYFIYRYKFLESYLEKKNSFYVANILKKFKFNSKKFVYDFVTNLYNKNNFLECIPKIISRKFLISLNYLLSLYFIIKFFYKKNNFFFFNKNNKEYIKILNKIYNNNIFLFEINNCSKIPLDSFENFNLPELKIKKLSILMRFFEKICFQKKFFLFFDDGTYKNNFNNKKVFFLNSKNFLKGFYFNFLNKQYYNKKNYNNIKKKLFYFLTQYLLKKERKKIFLKNDFFIIIFNLFKLIINKNIKKIYYNYNIYNEVLNYYNPKKIILVGESFYSYLVLNFIAQKKNIQTILLIDGFRHIMDKNLYLDSKNELVWDKIVVFDKKEFKYLSQIKNFKQKLIKSLPIFIDKKKIIKVKKIYDYVIFEYPGSHTENFTYFLSDKFLIIEELLNILNQQNINLNIALKFKGLKQKHAKEINLINSFLKICKSKFINIKLHLVDEHSLNVLMKSKNAIGALSTTLIESSFCKTPYYIYEPKCNGKHNYLNQCLIVNKIHIATNLQKLRYNMKNRSTGNINKSFFFRENFI